jgi:O-antigen ligase
LGHPHNNLLLIFSEAGVFGGVTFLLFLILLIWFSLHGWWQTKDVLYLVLLSILIGTQLHGITDTNIKMTVVSKAYWFLIGITLQIIALHCRELCSRQANHV